MEFSNFSVSSLARQSCNTAYPAALIALLLAGVIFEILFGEAPAKAPVFQVEASNTDLAQLPLMYD